ncbi:TPA: radical SAM protein [Burkholderia territorii]|uniref:radical SAM protein n=1 Tax=Burkholderia territorii TaxID=1503055 RepID=UPI0009C115B6|nr:radical SAM protein [Burkholderia territorii]TXG14147.1 radical SAM protein [Burkholderia territorii]HDR8860710.1 radical SAM protein [Burkholderia territorii]HDR8866847.1 radical SAM protein [Burkholderia territorii]HDR8873522.1 radical SAM protein [Burkholderia territorii]HDR8879333.1 radical SAM protein [Burkholderia territorii]
MKKIEAMDFPLFVKWYITQRCNLRCTHCYLTDYQRAPEFNEIVPIIDYLGARGVFGIVLMGGEPVARNDLAEIVRRITSHGMRSKIATNATLIDTEKAHELVDAGGMQYQVSLESPVAEENDAIRGPRTFARAVRGIRALVDAGARIHLAFTLTGVNYRRLESMFELAAALGVTGIKLNAFIPIGTGRLLARQHLLSPDMCREIAEAIVHHSSRFPGLDVEGGAFVKRIHISPNRSSSDATFGCGAGTTSMIINSDLTVSACDMLVEEDRTKQAIQSPADIDAMWRGDALFRRWRGQAQGERTPTIRSFDDVHQHGCHVAFNAYSRNLFTSES